MVELDDEPIIMAVNLVENAEPVPVKAEPEQDEAPSAPGTSSSKET